MENNQEHKIDKIFKQSLENQSVVPPSDAWMAVHTYTIGQEESKKKVWLRYASLALLLLFFSGLGLWYYVDNQFVKLVNNGSVPSAKVSSPVAGLPTSPLVSKQTQRLILPTPRISVMSASPPSIIHKNAPTFLTPDVDWSGDQPRDRSLLSHGLLVENTNTDGKDLINIIYSKQSTKKSIKDSFNLGLSNLKRPVEREPLIIELEDDNAVYGKEEFVSPVSSYFNIINLALETIEPKSLISSNLAYEFQKENQEKIVAFENKLDNQKENFKADSSIYGKKFSLKHPIINFRLGLYNNSVKMSANQGGEIPFSNDIINSNSIYAFLPSLDIAWKLNKKSRISLTLKYINYNTGYIQSKSGAAYIDPLSPNNKPTGTFKYNSQRDIYEYLTPFGYVIQPIDPKFSFTPKDFDVNLYGKISAWQIGANYEYDLIAFRNKKGGIPAMEIYGLVGLNIQKLNKYSYSFRLFKNYDPKDNIIDLVPYIPTIYTQTVLGNGSPIVFGYNTGLGIRFQLSKRFGLNISGNYEDSINSWVKDLPFKTRLSILSFDSGFFLNL